MAAARRREVQLPGELAAGDATFPVIAVEVVGRHAHAIEPVLHVRPTGDDARVVVCVDGTKRVLARRDQVVHRTSTMARHDAVLGFAVVQQLVLDRTCPHGRGIDGTIEHTAVAARRQAPFEFEFEVVISSDTDDVATPRSRQRELAIAGLPARIQCGLTDAAPLRDIGERLPWYGRCGRAAGCQCGEQDRNDPRAVHAQSTTRQNTAFR